MLTNLSKLPVHLPRGWNVSKCQTAQPLYPFNKNIYHCFQGIIEIKIGIYSQDLHVLLPQVNRLDQWGKKHKSIWPSHKNSNSKNSPVW